MFSRVPWDRVIGVVVLAAVSSMILAPPLLAALVAAVILAGVAIADTVLIRRHPGRPQRSEEASVWKDLEDRALVVLVLVVTPRTSRGVLRRTAGGKLPCLICDAPRFG